MTISFGELGLQRNVTVKGIETTLTDETCAHEDAAQNAKFTTDQKKASNIIVAALTDKALRVVGSQIGNPCKILEMLDERYASKSVASRIAKMTALITMKYDNIQRSMGSHGDQMAAVLEQLQGMNTPIPRELSIALLVASIQVPELTAVAAAVKTLPEESLTWEKVSASLLKEHQALKGKPKSNDRAMPSQKHCELCKKKGHSIEKCWLNPKNPHNRLDKLDVLKKGDDNEGKEKDLPNPVRERESPAQGESGRSNKKRAAVSKALLIKSSKKNIMMLQLQQSMDSCSCARSGTTTNMTNVVEALEDATVCSIPISLGDD